MKSNLKFQFSAKTSFSLFLILLDFRSCFGASIEALVQLTVPIAELDPGQVTSLEKGELEKL